MDTATKINIAVLLVNSIAAFAAIVAAIIAVRGNNPRRNS
jgi:mevalonate pyrophosphate decarboxylase